jgi:hypothetical protein
MAGMKIGRPTAGVLAIVALLVAILSGTADAKSFVSFSGKFHITYPETWEQIDYNSVDYMLNQNNPNAEALQYEAVFAQISDSPFYSQPYLLLTVDTIGELIGSARDSAIAAVVSGFSTKVDSSFGGDIISNLRPDTPLYDPKTHFMVVQTDIHEGRTITKHSLLVVRFYERGLANFYFYASVSAWEKSLPTFLQIAQSFSTSNLQDAMPKESVKIANLDKKESSELAIRRYWPLPTGIIVILIVILATRRRRARQANQSSQTS